MLKQYDELVQEVLEDIFVITRSEDEKLNQVIKKYFSAGGKRVRVLLLLICSKLGDFNNNKKNIIRMASIVEIIHTASLIHDDIIDKAETRRGNITLNKEFGDEFALLVGDYLFSIVLREVSEFENELIHSYLATTLKELCIGELIQEDGLYNLNTRRLDYLRKIKRKTAILIAFATVSGSIISGAKKEDVDSSYRFGYYLGMSYQIIDDYLDFAGGTASLGKETGQDLVNGNITLPALIAKEKNENLFLDFNRSINLEKKNVIIDYIKNNKDIKIGMLKAEQGKINVDKAWASKFFTVGYSGKAQEFLDKDFSKKGEAFQHYLTLSQPIYTGGKLKLNHEISKESLTLAQLNLDKVRKDTILSTVQAYIDVYNAMSTLGVLQKSKETLNENLKTQKELYDLRMTTKPELTEAERSLSSIEAQIVEQEGNIEVSKESLGILIGMKDSSQIEIVPFGVEDNFTKTVKLEDDLSKLKTENTEYKISMKQNDLSKKNVKLEEASYKPTVSGVINYGTLQSQDRFGNILKPRNFTTSAGVNWSWDIFDWGTRKNNVKYAKKTQEITELQVDQTLEVVQTNMKKTYYQLRALEKSIAALQLAVQKAEESYEMERERYSYRLITMENLLQSETNLRQARVNYAQAKLNYYFLVSKYGAYLD
mgnify:CR=1 FL=1